MWSHLWSSFGPADMFIHSLKERKKKNHLRPDLHSVWYYWKSLILQHYEWLENFNIRHSDLIWADNIPSLEKPCLEENKSFWTWTYASYGSSIRHALSITMIGKYQVLSKLSKGLHLGKMEQYFLSILMIHHSWCNSYLGGTMERFEVKPDFWADLTAKLQ